MATHFMFFREALQRVEVEQNSIEGFFDEVLAKRNPKYRNLFGVSKSQNQEKPPKQLKSSVPSCDSVQNEENLFATQQMSVKMSEENLDVENMDHDVSSEREVSSKQDSPDYLITKQANSDSSKAINVIMVISAF